MDNLICDAYENSRTHFALISPKTWEKEGAEKAEVMNIKKTIHEPEMTRYNAIKTIAEYLDEEAVVSNIGIPSKELYDNKGPRFIHVIVKPGSLPSVANMELTPEQIKRRFMKAML